MRMIRVQQRDTGDQQKLVNPMHVISVTGNEHSCRFHLTEDASVLSSWSIEEAFEVLNQAMA